MNSAPAPPNPSVTPVVATDGSCLRNPGGAIGWAWARDDGSWYAAGDVAGTNQIAELLAVLAALRCHPDTPLVLQVDSTYAVNVATRWAARWARNGWRTAAGAPVANRDLVQQIHDLTSTRPRSAPVQWARVRGHDRRRRFPLNDAADRHAGRAAQYAAQTGQQCAFTGHKRGNVTTPPRC